MAKFSTQVKQQQDQHWHPHYLLISGTKSCEAKKWLLNSLKELEKMEFPDDWENPVKNFLEKKNLHTYELPKGHKTWKMIEGLVE